MPAKQPCQYAVALKLSVENLKGFKPELAVPPVPTVQADASGNFTLPADEAQLHGDLKTENKGGQPNIGFWDKAGDRASWKVNFKQPGKFKVTACCAAANGDSAFVVEVAGQKTEGKPRATGSWEKFAAATRARSR